MTIYLIMRKYLLAGEPHTEEVGRCKNEAKAKIECEKLNTNIGMNTGWHYYICMPHYWPPI